MARRLGRKGLSILGDPGSGKTTHLKRILLYCVSEGPEKLGLPKGMVPVFLPLRELKSVKAGLDSFIQEQLSDANLGTPPGFGKKLLEDRGNLLLLFDGLDEISDFKHRQKVSRWIENALQYHHKSCFFVATSRFAGYKDNVRLNEHFLEMHVRPPVRGTRGAIHSKLVFHCGIRGHDRQAAGQNHGGEKDERIDSTPESTGTSHPPGVRNDEDLWRRQPAALKVLERWDPSALGPLMDIIRNHPFPEISRRAKDADAKACQKTIRPGPSQYELVWVPGGRVHDGFK